MNLSYQNNPYPHIIGSIEEDLYKQVYDSWETIVHENYSEISGNRSNIPMPAGDIFNKISNVLFECYSKFQEDYFGCYKKLTQIDKYDVAPRVLYSENKATDYPYKIRGMHLDTGDKHLVGLWYFKHPEDTATGSDLLLLNPITKEKKVVKYGSNVFIVFPNLMTSWHAVTPRNPSLYPRRYINCLLESPDVKLHNYQRTGTTVDSEFRDKLVNYYE